MARLNTKGWIMVDVPTIPLCIVREDRYRCRVHVSGREIVCTEEDLREDLAEIWAEKGRAREYRAEILARDLMGSVGI